MKMFIAAAMMTLSGLAYAAECPKVPLLGEPIPPGCKADPQRYRQGEGSSTRPVNPTPGSDAVTDTFFKNRPAPAPFTTSTPSPLR